MAKVQSTSFVRRTFQKIDANNDGQIDAKEVKKHLGRVGVGAGIFGIVHNKAAGAFISQFDANGDKKISWSEFQGKARNLMPRGIFDSQGRIDRKKAGQFFSKADRNGDGKLTIGELRKAILKALPRGTSFKGTVADIAAKLGVDALDANGDKKISRQEFEAALRTLEKLAK